MSQSIEQENAQLKARLAELATMLNNAGKDRVFAVENERDACERAVRQLGECWPVEEDKKHFQRCADVIHARKDRAVQWVSEMANGTVLGEFVKRMVDEALERERAKSAEVKE